MRNLPSSLTILTLSLMLTTLLPSPALSAEGDDMSDQPVSWGTVHGVELSAPFSGMDVPELLAVSLGAMPPDLARDGLPWFGAVRDDFLHAPRDHKGLDFYGDNLAIRAMAPGRVVSRSSEKRAGYYVTIDHGGGVSTRYLHLEIPYTGPAAVNRGDIVGVTGISGNAVSPQLHLEILVDGKPVDPVTPLAEAADPETAALIDSYRSLMPVKLDARGLLVKAYLSTDATERQRITREALDLLGTIAADPATARWIDAFDPTTGAGR